MKLAIVQSSYIPWRGYFDLIRRADAFILYDAVDYTARDWRNRNRINTHHGPHWLTIPVGHVSRGTPVSQVRVAGSEWAALHRNTLHHAYAHAAYYSLYDERLTELYRTAAALTSLSEINALFTEALCGLLGISTPLHPVHTLTRSENPSLDLALLCEKHGAKTYLSGPSARAYLCAAPFTERGIALEWMEYGHYRPYPTCHPAFHPQASIMDLLLNCGPQSLNYLD